MKNANPVYRLALGVALGSAAVELTGCGREPAPAAPVHQGIETRFPIRVGQSELTLQLAALPSELEHGLMGRGALGASEGMLFVFDRPQRLSFWMRNTQVPLDVGYFTPDGTLAEIYPMYPRDERTVASHSGQLQYALEMNLGWFSANGVHPGDRMDLAALRTAVRARGFDPERLNLPPGP